MNLYRITADFPMENLMKFLSLKKMTKDNVVEKEREEEVIKTKLVQNRKHHRPSETMAIWNISSKGFGNNLDFIKILINNTYYQETYGRTRIS